MCDYVIFGFILYNDRPAFSLSCDNSYPDTLWVEGALYTMTAIIDNSYPDTLWKILIHEEGHTKQFNITVIRIPYAINF